MMMMQTQVEGVEEKIQMIGHEDESGTFEMRDFRCRRARGVDRKIVACRTLEEAAETSMHPLVSLLSVKSWEEYSWGCTRAVL